MFRHHLTLGELIAFNSYLGFLLMPIMMIGFLAAMISRAGASALRVFELLDAPLEVTDAPDAQPLPPLVGRVEFRDVRFRYAGSEREILRGVSFAVEPGQMVALLGTTGAGKSTVINLIPRFYDVTGGAVLVDGVDVRRRRWRRLRAQVGVVLQEALLFSGVGARQHRLRPARRVAARTCARRRSRRRRTSSSRGCRRATTPSSASAASASRADSGSASPSRACCSRSRACSSSTTAPRPSTPRRRWRSRARSIG